LCVDDVHKEEYRSNGAVRADKEVGLKVMAERN
jgi:hypothetical protein